MLRSITLALLTSLLGACSPSRETLRIATDATFPPTRLMYLPLQMVRPRINCTSALLSIASSTA